MFFFLLLLFLSILYIENQNSKTERKKSMYGRVILTRSLLECHVTDERLRP